MRRLALLAFLCLSPAVGHAQQSTVRSISNAPIYLRPEVLPTPLRVATTGTRLNVLRVEGNWAQVEFKDPSFGRRVGWVQLRRVENRRATMEPRDLSVPGNGQTAPAPSAAPAPSSARSANGPLPTIPTAVASSEVRPAPAPGRLMGAKSAVVVNVGVWVKVFDKFCADLAKWNRFRLVQRKEDADITILLSSTPGDLFGGNAVPTGRGGIGRSKSKFYMRISDTRTGTPLWTDVAEEAGLVSNSGNGLVSNLRRHMVEK
jgi:hypothetical protein